MSKGSKKDVVKKANALTNARTRLSSTEQRLILLAIVQAKGKATMQTELEIRAEDYAKQYGVATNTAYEALKDASNDLFDRSFSYEYIDDKGNLNEVKSRWVQSRTYVNGEGVVKIAFTDKVLPLISDLEREFTYYELERISRLTSQYSIRIYEMLIAWRTKGEMPTISLTELKKRLGIEGKYKAIKDFKKYVLDLAINEINEHTDLIAKYEQHKRGRTISGFTFSFKFKKEAQERDPNTVDFIEGVTDNEKRKRKTITKAQAEKMANVGESYQDLYRRLSKDYIIKDDSLHTYEPFA